MTGLAVTNAYEGKDAQAESLFSQTLTIQQRVLGPENLYTLFSMNNLADVYADEAKYAQVEDLNSQVLKIRSRVLGPEDPYTLASMQDLANDYMKVGRYAPAEALYSQTLGIEQRVLGPENHDTAVTKYNLDCLEAKRGNSNKAIASISNASDHGLPPYVDLSIGQDTDLTSLHNDPRFAALVAHAKQRTAAASKSKCILPAFSCVGHGLVPAVSLLVRTASTPRG